MTKERINELIKSLPVRFREKAQIEFGDIDDDDDIWETEYLEKIWIGHLMSIREYMTIEERKQCKYIGREQMNLLESDIKGYFTDWNFEVIDIDKCIEYLNKHGYLNDFEDVVEENIEYYEIQCPEEFLNKEIIVEHDNDYIEVGDGLWNVMYLNRYLLEDCDGFKELLENKIIKKEE